MRQTTATSVSLLGRLRDAGDQAAWREFDERYRPLITAFCRRRGISMVDAEDIAQLVIVNLARALPGFQYAPEKGRFRDYLFRCVRNALAKWAKRPGRDWKRIDTDAADQLEQTAEADPGEAVAWEEEWVAHHYRMALDTLKATYPAQSVAVFERLIAGATVAQIAAELDLSEAAVLKTRQRVRARFQEIIAEQVRAEDSF